MRIEKKFNHKRRIAMKDGLFGVNWRQFHEWQKKRQLAEQQKEKLTETKICAHCGRELPVEKYYKNSGTKDGLQSWCKDCQNKIKNERCKELRRELRREKPRALSAIPAADLIEELKRRGYVGTLRLRKENTIEMVED